MKNRNHELAHIYYQLLNRLNYMKPHIWQKKKYQQQKQRLQQLIKENLEKP